MCRLTNLAVALCLDRVCGSQYLRRLNLRSPNRRRRDRHGHHRHHQGHDLGNKNHRSRCGFFSASEEAHMKYKPKSVAALQVAIGGLPAAMHVETDRDVGISAKTVGELRKVTAWPENLVITTPQERYSESAIRISKATHATRVTPKS